MNINSPVKIWRNQQQIIHHRGKEGVIISWTLIRVPPGNFSDQAPYLVAVVRLDDGVMITSQVVDVPDFQITAGQRVRTVLRRVYVPTDDGVIPYGVKVTPL